MIKHLLRAYAEIMHHKKCNKLGILMAVEQNKLPEGMERDEEGFPRFAVGNELWRLAKNYMRKDKKFETPEELLAKVLDYFQWAEDNPLQESKLVSYEGSSSIEEVPKMRALTLRGLTLHIGVGMETWGGWRRGDRVDLADVIAFAESYLYARKFDGAAAGLLSSNLIARELGLAEKTEMSGHEGGPIQTSSIDWSKLDTSVITALLAAKKESNDDNG